MMRKVLLFAVFACLSLALPGQVQEGYVKTKGRLGSSGKVIAGTRLSGATITVKGGNKVVSGNNGAFTLSIPTNNYYLQNVQKKGYVLTDPEILFKQYVQSKNPLVLVLEDKAQQEADRRAVERKISSNLYAQLQKRSDELETLREQQKITEEKYREMLQQLNRDQDDNEKIIKDMVERYAKMDFDQIDEFNRRISDCIINGRLTEADSLLRTKGDINSRVRELNRHHNANEQKRTELEQSESAEKKNREDIAQDCYSKYEIFKMQHQNDSAAYYIELRAELDSTNVYWLFDAARYLQDQEQYSKSEVLYKRALKYLRHHYIEPDGTVYISNVTGMLNNLAELYKSTRRYANAESIYKILLGVNRRLADLDPTFEADVAHSLNNLALLYCETRRLADAELMYKEALGICKRLAVSDSSTYEPSVAMVLNNLAGLYHDTRRYIDAELMYKESLVIYRRLAILNSQVYEPDLAGVLRNLTELYGDTHRFVEAELTCSETLELYRRLADNNPRKYTTVLVSTLGNLSFYIIFIKKYVMAEQCAREALSIDSTQHWIYANLAAALLFQGRFDEAEQIYRQYKDELKDVYLDDFKQFAEAGVIPEERKEDVERIKRILTE